MFRAGFRIPASIVLGLALFFGIALSAQEAPPRLSDEAFWKLVTDYSEPGGTFVSDNFVSNELGSQHVLKNLAQGRTSGGAYLGVGPEQNFTYIVALKPDIAFIFDIRRQNMILHLMYKALIELSNSRVDFLTLLFSRIPVGYVGTESSAVELFDAFRQADPDRELSENTLASIKERLIKDHGFQLTDEDQLTLDYVMQAFYVGGTDLGYAGPWQRLRSPLLPSYEQLMVDTDENGEFRSFLATEENFLALQQFEKNNLIVPLVGNFAGPKAIRAVGEYLRARNLTVAAFYLSNVEHYLFMNPDDWKAFYSNVATLPLDSRSVFIRPLIKTGNEGYSASPILRRGYSWDTLLFSIQDLVTAFDAGMIQSYYDIIQMPN